MDRILENIEPKEVLKYFEEISKIPRASKNEKQISDYLLEFGRKVGVEVVQDENLNIYMRKGASKGYENGKGVIFQGHMDMVCEKNDGINHDFNKDPLNIRVIDGKIYATHTTLGADNGIAVAYIMALMASEDISHPEIEALITVEEETSMNGAKTFDPKFFRGKYLINIDSMYDSKLLVSCSGGLRSSVVKNVSREKAKGYAFDIKVRGLKGGHSGIDINKGRGNANKILGRILKSIEKNFNEFNIVSLSGGAKDNAIPREAECQICFKERDEGVLSLINSLELEIKNELECEENFHIISNESDMFLKDSMISLKDTRDLINLIYLMPNGIRQQSMSIEGLVVTSNNFGVISFDDDKVILKNAIRSSIDSSKLDLAVEIEALSSAFSACAKMEASYPGWEYDKNSEIREIAKKVYKEMFNEEMEVYAIHAGVECGLIKEKLPHLDMVSFGPIIEDNHTPGEWVLIKSINKVWNFIKEILLNIK